MRRTLSLRAILVVSWVGVACGGTNAGTSRGLEPRATAQPPATVSAPPVALATPEPRVHRAPRALRVLFEGNDKVPTKDLLAAMLIDKDTPDTLGIANAQVLERDVLSLTALYYDRGYLQVAIEPPRLEHTDTSLDIQVKVSEGPQFRLGKLVIEERLDGKVVAPLGGRAGLRSKISLREGDVFARDVFVRELQEVWRIYRDAGYANVQADPETSLDLARSVVNVTVPIRRMGHTTIARIRIVAPDATHAAIRQALHVTEGQAFNETALERAKVQLLALGLFRRVDLSLQAVPSDTFITVTIEAEP
jgi:outer membrane protein insertion porin family